MKKGVTYTIRPLKPNEIYVKQEMWLNRMNEMQNIEIVKKYSDISYPAINPKRPALNEMTRFLSHSEEKMDFVLFFAVEHFEKDRKRINYVLPLIEKHVKEVIFQDSEYTAAIIPSILQTKHTTQRKTS
ncbi:hypothetical protein [Oceanobacillus halophilus]|uniref:Resolvase/invertase-type recombinase catalytic domain-containing protein n=1 Tax=Oceanobacillus halophilus TaxID=930130 RepID=A0A495A7T5_9BACI|nr:hypothetical protein [Oceanobacillus halophilus]RKQ35852.1 hypothetical protein D8M06_06260 [Oceanobacillus halophilus]